MLLLNSAEVEQALPMIELIEAIKEAFIAISAGHVALPLRTKIPVGDPQNVTLFMPAYMNHKGHEGLCLKSVSVFPGNIDLGLPTIHAVVVAFNSETGQIEALIEGGSLTALRTGAASGAATDALAPEDSCVAAIFGAGIQGRTQIKAICSIRNLERVWVFDTNKERAEIFIDELSGQDPIPGDLRVATSPQEAVKDADIICAATTSNVPVFNGEDIKPGVHINGVGSYTPDMVEIPPDVFRDADLFVGSKQGVLSEAGEILSAIEKGIIVEDQLVEIGEVFAKNIVGRKFPDQVTVFKSVGNAAQDVSATTLALKNARELGLGRIIDW